MGFRATCEMVTLDHTRKTFPFAGANHIHMLTNLEIISTVNRSPSLTSGFFTRNSRKKRNGGRLLRFRCPS